MQAKLTQSVVTDARSGTKDIYIVDTLIPGFELRVRAAGSKVWTYRYRTQEGNQRRFVLGRFPGTGAAAARQLALKAAADVAQGADVQKHKQVAREEGARIRGNTLKVFLETHYEPWVLVHLRTGEFQVKRIKADFVEWLNKPMMELNTWLVEGWRRRQRTTTNKSPITINRNLQRLQALLSRAVEWNVIERHPFAGLKPLKHDRSGRVRYLNEGEEARLREALLARETELRQARDRFNEWRRIRGRETFPPRVGEHVDHLRAMVLLAFNTGLRRGELFNLCWKDVDLDAKWLIVRGATAKSGQTRRMPLNAEAFSILEGWRKQDERKDAQVYVFPGVGGKRLNNINTSWRRLVKLAKLDDFRFHDLRHHFASRLVQSGVDLNTVRELMGHADIEMVLRYAHLSPGHLATAVEKVAR